MGQSRVYKWDNLKVFMIIGIVLEHSLIITAGHLVPADFQLFII